MPEICEYLSDPIGSSKSFNDTDSRPEFDGAAVGILSSLNPIIGVEKPDGTEHKKDLVARILDGDSRKLYRIIAEKEEILQNELVLESGFSKVKVSLILKKLEDKSLVERKPYGNTNKIIVSL
ncbi:helix-turn-helix transcriptional regulator [Methanococcoides methylutens]|uniref:helix-turn-helix transcriptional regulator n=1 Tax=Methanococcoides methylutens TaxID=2226 RepID=UPI0040446D5D